MPKRITDHEIKVRQLSHYDFTWVAGERQDGGTFTLQLVLDEGACEEVVAVTAVLQALLKRSGFVYYDIPATHSDVRCRWRRGRARRGREAVGRPRHVNGFREREAGQFIVMNDRVSRIAKGAAKRGVSAAGRGAAAAARDVAKLGARATRSGYEAASIERCPHCGEPSKTKDSVCPHCGREKDTHSQ